MSVRLQKMIADNSDYSRRKAESLIAEGKVTVNGEVVTEMGVKVTDSDEIIVDNAVIYTHEKVYYLINKPTEVISSRKDNFKRHTVVEFVPETIKVYPVGRLDYNTSGLLLLTNDGELTNGLTQPRFEIPKTYVAKLKGKYTKADLYRLEEGVVIDGQRTKPCSIKTLTYNPKNNSGTVEITIYEGRNLQVRKMFKAIGADVIKLKRTKYAFFDLATEKLGEGHYRELKVKEVRQLYNLLPASSRKKGK